LFTTDKKPSGYKLEDKLSITRQDIVKHATMIDRDNRLGARQVMANNMRILES
tara:strand:- start:830 stop:988 length:159 start_codon:yes stop_codon:yes gene_type:complete